MKKNIIYILKFFKIQKKYKVSKIFCKAFMLLALIILISGFPKKDKSSLSEINDYSINLYDTNGFSEESKWTRINKAPYKASSPQNIVLQNGLVKICFDEYRLFTEQRGSHSWFFRKNGKYIRATDPVYGDYTYFVSTVRGPPSAVNIIEITKETIMVDFIYSDHYNLYDFSITDGSGLTKEIKAGPYPFTKRIQMYSKISGAFVKYLSTPSNPNGEREISLGMGSDFSFGVAGDYVCDLFKNTNSFTEILPVADYYLGFNDNPYINKLIDTENFNIPDIKNKHLQKNSFLIITIPPKQISSCMYKFSKKSFGGPIIQYLYEIKNCKGVFLGIIPYENPFYMEAELLDSKNTKVLYYDDSPRNSVSLKIEQYGKLSILPQDGLLSGSYKIVLRAKYTKSTLKITQDESYLCTQNISEKSDDFVNLVLTPTFHINNKNQKVSFFVQHGELNVDAIYYIPISSNESTFPKEIANQVFNLIDNPKF